MGGYIYRGSEAVEVVRGKGIKLSEGDKDQFSGRLALGVRKLHDQGLMV